MALKGPIHPGFFNIPKTLEAVLYLLVLVFLLHHRCSMNQSSCLLFTFSILFLSLSFNCQAQNKRDSSKLKQDSLKNLRDTTNLIQDIKNSKVSKKFFKTITRKKTGSPTATIKSEDFFVPYTGKIIRKIIIRKIGFDKTVTDTTRSFKNTLTRMGNKLHGNSKDWLIRDNLFIHENKPVNPYKMADNERYLRDLDFLLDAKLFIVPLKHTEDSVDVIVMTRDVFSIGASFNPRSATKTRFKIYDTNLFGFGQRVQFTGLVEEGRSPAFGYEMLYRKNSVGGSFLNATAGYTQLNTGSSYGKEEEKAYYIKLDRPLVSPYTRLAGGMEVSRNWSHNIYQKGDTIFRRYLYRVNDFWIGYNIGANANYRDRNRHFLAIRAFDQRFTRLPSQNQEANNPIYNNRTYVLGGLTFFKQNFYTARYIYGFGRTEDVPYGHTMSIYFGWARQLGLQRPYVGVDVGKSLVSPNGQFYNLLFRAGAFNNDGLEDAAVLVSGTLTSRLINYGNLLIRQIIGADISYVYNQRISLPLDINNEFGIRGFVADSLWGTKRFHLNTETVAFTPLSLLGFKFAPFLSGEMAWLAPRNQTLFQNDAYFGLGGGFRTRNENLVFGTVEVRMMFYPRTYNDNSNFNIRVSSNLRVKYSATFVKPPSFVQYN